MSYEVDIFRSSSSSSSKSCAGGEDRAVSAWLVGGPTHGPTPTAAQGPGAAASWDWRMAVRLSKGCLSSPRPPVLSFSFFLLPHLLCARPGVQTS